MSIAIDWSEFGDWNEDEAKQIEKSIVENVIDWCKFGDRNEEGAQAIDNELLVKKVIWNGRTMCNQCVERNKRYVYAQQRLALARLAVVGLEAQIRELDAMLKAADEPGYSDKMYTTFLYEHFNELQTRLRSADRTLHDAVDYETRCDYELQHPCGRYSGC